MKLTTKFIPHHPQEEPLSEMRCPQHLIDEYVRNDAERANLPVPVNSVVYDSIDPSPFYSNTGPGDMYIDEKEHIELQSPHVSNSG